MENLEGLKVAILVTDGFEEVELTRPFSALNQKPADLPAFNLAMLELFGRGHVRVHQEA
ncbi:MAG TPA: hypothetical protein VGQ74_13320 [Methylomirabilota bacterium]|jgi:hypothetical protein|nr:hypothetical protein [Methylomirabilota bacterium]